MKLKLLPLVALVLTISFACEKNEQDQASIQGTLTPIDGQSDIQLNEIYVYLGKYSESIAFEDITIDTNDVELLDSTKLTEDGFFEFTDLEKGNYALALQPQYIFSMDTIQILELDEHSSCTINKTIEYLSVDNAVIIPILGFDTGIQINKSLSIENYLNSPNRLDSCGIYFSNKKVGSSFLGNVKGKQKVQFTYSSDCGTIGIEFVFFDEGTQTYSYSSVLIEEKGGERITTNTGTIKIVCDKKWFLGKLIFFIDD